MMLSVPTISSRIATKTTRPAPLMWAPLHLPAATEGGRMQAKLLLGSAGAGGTRAGQRGRASDQVLQASHTPVVLGLSCLSLGQLAATRLVAAPRPPGTGSPQANRRNPGNRRDEHPHHGGAELALQGHHDTEGEVERDAGDDRKGGAAAPGVERDEADDQAAADDRCEDHGID